LQRQKKDPYVRRAQSEGWRSRAVYKLQEIHDKERLLKPGAVVVDLGAAPGGWSQFAIACVKPGGRVVALDRLAIEPLADVEMIQGDFSSPAVLQQLLALTEGGVDLVMSDMAPNISGNRAIDQPRSMHLAELALDFAGRVLNPGGHFVSKLFQGQGFEEFVAEARKRFGTVRIRKPRASRPGSREMYLVARNYRI
jgi:23S rRNA (uridine2552-2'-O)-methyltransferase